MSSSTTPRTLADQLRGWSDQQLATLLSERPDLANPAPQDSSQLASRAGTRASVLRALDQLDTLELTVLDALVAEDCRCSSAALLDRVNARGEVVAAGLGRLRDLALVWGADDDLRVVSAVAETLGTTVSGLGQPLEQLLQPYGPDRVATLVTDLGERSTGDRAADVRLLAERLGDPGFVAAQLSACDPAAGAMLEHLDETGSDGASEHARRPVTLATARTPVEQLVARGLLLAKDGRHLGVPREVGFALRGGRTTRVPVDQVPETATSERATGLVDQAAAGAAYELVHRTELLLDHWGAEPPAALRQGGLGVRDLKGVAALLHCDERVAALLVETAAAAGLLAKGAADDLDTAWLPTDAYDAWRSLPLASRWTRLASAWLHNPRLTGLVGSRVQGKGVNALAPELERGWVVDSRLATLAELATLEPGQVLAAGTGVPSLVARLRWQRPRRPSTRAEAVSWTIEEGAVVGVIALGGLAGHGRALLEGVDRAAEVVDPLLPAPVDHVLLQADLTAVAPGPLEEGLARDLATVAHVESRGGATVYRFTEASVRHAFDVGWSAAEVHELVARASRTEVPQPLRYLVDDVARTFGKVRIGTVEAFLRSDDEAALEALVRDPRAAQLRLRRIAPTVIVTGTQPEELLPVLREIGVAPVLEGADGVVRVSRRDLHRARTPRASGPGHAAEVSARTTARSAATVTAIRAGDRNAALRPPATDPAARQSPAAILAMLREAAEVGASVWIGYVDNDGSSHDRVVDPVRVEGGRLLAVDHRTEEDRTFAAHRINSVRPLPPT